MARKKTSESETMNKLEEMKDNSEIESIKAKLNERGYCGNVFKIEKNELISERESGLKVQVSFGYCGHSVAVKMLSTLAETDKEALSSKDINTQCAILNRYNSLMYGMKPQDEIEAMLMSQMITAYELSMKTCKKLAHCEYLNQHDSYSNTANKAMRTYAALVEALTKYRTKGQQKVIVEHVTVNDGGQAIVGNVSTGGRGKDEKLPYNPTQ